MVSFPHRLPQPVREDPARAARAEPPCDPFQHQTVTTELLPRLPLSEGRCLLDCIEYMFE
jgi:hypothetical protein